MLYRSLARGLSFKTTMGNVLTLTPPLTITEAEMREGFATIDKALTVVDGLI